VSSAAGPEDASAILLAHVAQAEQLSRRQRPALGERR
jgi:hypothetical protein